MKQIKLSIVAAQYIWPVNLDPYSAARDLFASKLLGKMK
jgi:hypothetical protein